jgi:hypothetical protein
MYHLQNLDGDQKAVTDAINTQIEADFKSCFKGGKFAEPSVLHLRDVILKGTMLI